MVDGMNAWVWESWPTTSDPATPDADVQDPPPPVARFVPAP
jgi:hypothetical protein